VEIFTQEQSEKPVANYQAINPAFHRLGIILFEIAQSETDDSAPGGKGKQQGNLQYQNGKRVINTAKMTIRRKIEPLPPP
jgi:hypothetical protein